MSFEMDPVSQDGKESQNSKDDNEVDIPSHRGQPRLVRGSLLGIHTAIVDINSDKDQGKNRKRDG